MKKIGAISEENGVSTHRLDEIFNECCREQMSNLFRVYM